MTRFTGRHMALLMLAFFGTVVAVNVAMARLAASSWTGLVAKNGYVASIDYARNSRNREAAAALGWTVAVGAEDGRVVVAVRDAGGAVSVAATGSAERPGGEPVPLALAGAPLVSTAALEPGGWIVRLHLTHGGDSLDWRAPVTLP